MTIWRVVNAAVYSLGPASLMCDCSWGVYEQPRYSANMVAQGQGKFGPIIVADPRKSFRLKIKIKLELS